MSIRLPRQILVIPRSVKGQRERKRLIAHQFELWNPNARKASRMREQFASYVWSPFLIMNGSNYIQIRIGTKGIDICTGTVTKIVLSRESESNVDDLHLSTPRTVLAKKEYTILDISSTKNDSENMHARLAIDLVQEQSI